MTTKKKYSQPKLYEFRIKYNAGADHSVQDSYHYYQAENASQAMSFHKNMMKRKNFYSQTLSVEKKCPYRNKWMDESDEVKDELD